MEGVVESLGSSSCGCAFPRAACFLAKQAPWMLAGDAGEERPVHKSGSSLDRRSGAQMVTQILHGAEGDAQSAGGGGRL